MKLDKVVQRITQRFGVSTVCSDALVVELVRACQLPDSGARHIDRLLDQQILPVLSRELLVRSAQGQMPSVIRLGYSDEDGVTVDFEAGMECVA